ncbi:hypothetical protein SAMN05892883_2517 [Jatrophihabitans sp. GAS493]|uniref:hypothetical protein n=1 Tax=Jatrophihabitans sp. GAS493 TaxID=1907575 RepID=UPI000BB8C593|nr:hypothetical protein [Jatrophihabitans sp. GAS493]SOD73226.1 hypothetical protein SAMN05892883_2517 [Jatrophihabitans sp. GAS493]
MGGFGGDATQLRAVNRAIEELQARVGDAQSAYGNIPPISRLVNDIERLRIDAGDLVGVPTRTPEPALTPIQIDNTPVDALMWRDADDEGIGGYHGTKR